MDGFNIENTQNSSEAWNQGGELDINGQTSGDFSFLVQEKIGAGLFQVRDNFSETLHESFSCHLFNTDNRDMTKALINKLIDILFW